MMEALLERMQRDGQGRNFFTSCEAELQELMKQIDIMVAHKKSEWECQTQSLESRLVDREQEVSTLRNALDDKRKEIERLCQRLEGMEQLNHEISVEYEHQLNTVQVELGKLKRCYEKLQKKQQKECKQHPKCHVEESCDVRILTEKLAEFRQKSLDWEMQRLRYQQHVASLEEQRRSLAEQSEYFQAQLSNRKHVFESVEMENRSEIQHLASQLERANDTICANELEIERLNMRVEDLTCQLERANDTICANEVEAEKLNMRVEDLTSQLERAGDTICANESKVERINMRMEDLNDINQKILEKQRFTEDELKMSRSSLEVLQEEKMELKATLLSQDDFINGLKVQNEQLQEEVCRLMEALNKETHMRSIEEHLQKGEEAKESYYDGSRLDHAPMQLDYLEATCLEGSLRSTETTSFQLNKELTENCHKLQLTEDRLCQAKKEIKKLKDQLFHIERSHSCELEGMKQEVSHLTRELHQRDITIASSKSPVLGVEHLRTAEYVASDRRVAMSQLEILKQEHQHFSEILQEQAKSTPLEEPQERYTLALNKAKTDNQRLQKELAGTRASFDTSSWVSKDTHENIVRQLQHQITEIKNTDIRRIQELQCKHDEEIRAHRARYDKAVQDYEEELQKSKRLLAKPTSLSATAAGVSLHITRTNSVESLSCDPLLESGSLPTGNREFAHVFNITSSERECLSPLPTANVGKIAAKFLEEEEERSQHILDRLDAHIEELKRESEKTVQQFTHQK